jgi:hypothetical protein
VREIKFQSSETEKKIGRYGIDPVRGIAVWTYRCGTRESKMRKAGLVATMLAAVSLGALGTWGIASDSESASASDLGETPYTQVLFEDPIPTGPVKKSKAEEEECTTGCSLAKHAIPDFTPYDFEKTLAAYAALPATQVSEELEKLLFYGSRTKQLLEEVGTADLPAGHLAYLQTELDRDQAVVSLRLVDDANVVRVS